MGTRSSIRGLTVLGLLAAVAFGAAVAGAALRTRSASAPLNGYGAVASPTAECRAGQRLVSGGFDHPDFGLNAYVEPYGLFFSSHRVGRRGWSSAAKNMGNGDGTVVSFAYCAKGRGLRTRSASGPVPYGGSSLGTVTAQCKPGEKVVSGGFDNPDFEARPWFIFSSYRSGPRSWTAAAENSSGTDGQLDVFAYCRKRGRVRTRSGSAIVPHNVAAAGTAVAHCKPGERLLSGGFSNPGQSTTNPAPNLFYFSSHRAGKRGWTASAVNTGGADGTVTAYTYCQPK